MKKTKLSGKQKILLLCVVLAAVLLLLILPTVSWFFQQRGLQTATEIQTSNLQIWQGHYNSADDADEQSYLQLGDINTEEGTEQEYVFCVYGGSAESYRLQLGYTTNNPFTYTIYKAQESSGSAPETVSGAVIDPNGGNYYYTKVSEGSLSGSYLNLSSEGTASEEYHETTFGSYGYVQKNAEPVYWQSDEQTLEAAQGLYIDYYILKISWPKGTKNNKETDMIYLLASS